MPEVFPSDGKDAMTIPRLSEPRSRTETRYGEPTFVGTRERQIFRGQSSIGSRDPFRRRVEQTAMGQLLCRKQREKGITTPGGEEEKPPQPPPLHGVGEQSNTETASRTCGGTLAGFNVPASVLFCRIRASAREERSGQARGKAREGTGEKEGEGPPRCFSCSPIRYINIPNRDSRRKVLGPAVSRLRNPPEDGVLGLFSLIGQHGTVPVVLTTISIRAETKREREIDWT
ncbi:hypothetical protein G5I_03337 [Acromyrmex echinatior]|uniref:Uncharacterized protein n=1 Tax=Acromyrmex echinatior TaxID=103372 RepID=F4WCR1_ACREC|nr:hypothetical protein G5I_03337 [Acromyrmex echinatior]